MEMCENCRWWYLAGIIDGEGSISFTLYKTPNSNKVWYGLRIGISNTCKEWLDLIRQLYPQFTNIGKHTGRVESYEAYISGVDNKIYILEHVVDKLVVKQKMAKLALEFLKLRKKAKHPFPVKEVAPYSDEEVKLMEQMLLSSPRSVERRLAFFEELKKQKCPDVEVSTDGKSNQDS